MANVSQKLFGNSTKPSLGSGDNDSMLEEFFTACIKDIFYAEKLIIVTLPKMIKAATSSDLIETFEVHLEVTKTQVTRLERIFELLGQEPLAKKCEAIEGIVKEGESIIEETEEGSATRDVGLIFAAQKVEHYEIATYGGLVQLATTLGMDEVAELLRSTLEEEKEADLMLSDIAESNINEDAADEDGEDNKDKNNY